MLIYVVECNQGSPQQDSTQHTKTAKAFRTAAEHGKGNNSFFFFFFFVCASSTNLSEIENINSLGFKFDSY